MDYEAATNQRGGFVEGTAINRRLLHLTFCQPVCPECDEIDGVAVADERRGVCPGFFFDLCDCRDDDGVVVVQSDVFD